MTRRLVILIVALAALAAPADALAHGRAPVVAVDYLARITSTPVRAKIVDGDQRLWLQIPRGTSVVTVLGLLREPFLRFDRNGVFVNRASPTAVYDGVTRAGRGWHKLTGGTSYVWHEHRLHSGAATWAIPLVVDGRAAAITGTLTRVPSPRLWAWLIPIVVLIGAAFLLRAWTASFLAFPVLTAAGIVVARAGRNLYGRPDVAATAYASLGIASALGLLALVALAGTRGNTRAFAAFVVGGAGIYEGIVLLPVLWHGLVLAALPNWLERASVAAALGGGAATCLLYLLSAREG